MQTGIMLTTPGGNRFWHPCPDAEKGYQEMASVPWLYGKAWEHPDTVVEFGTSDGKTFTASQRLWPKS